MKQKENENKLKVNNVVCFGTTTYYKFDLILNNKVIVIDYSLDYDENMGSSNAEYKIRDKEELNLSKKELNEIDLFIEEHNIDEIEQMEED